MADYQRFVSYIYSYPGGVKDKNVGFAKVEVVRGEILYILKQPKSWAACLPNITFV